MSLNKRLIHVDPTTENGMSLATVEIRKDEFAKLLGVDPQLLESITLDGDSVLVKSWFRPITRKGWKDVQEAMQDV